MTQPKTVDSLLCGRWVMTTADSELLSHHAVVVDNHSIIDILPTETAKSCYQPKHCHELNDHVLMPGLINMHGHAAMTLFRGLADDTPLQTWLTEHIWPAEQRWLNPEFVKTGTQLAIIEMLRSGITCFSDMYFFPETVAETAKTCGIRCQIASPIINFPSTYAQNADEYLHNSLELHDNYRHDDLITTAFGPHAVYTLDDAYLTKINTYAEELNLPIQIHLHENAQEVQDYLQQFGCRPIEKLQQLELLSNRLQAVHMTQLTSNDIDLLHTHNVHIIHCPKSNLKLASGICPTTELVQQGINIALGTDSAASNNALSLWDEMRFAALLAKNHANKANALNTQTILQFATQNAAMALDLHDKIGSLHVGKYADIIAIDMSSPESQPLYHPKSQLVYVDQSPHVTHSWIHGKLMMENRELKTIDYATIKTNLTSWHQRIAT